ncbi:hypothetical protein ONS95_008939 [Cadophora gregata]|uniref:uncharacterized protein n=1 Tax=Cadophora gregata TaxID=51156 RepID=UPI0026DD0D76|nr:uncharacterized protein ONS95_008939 [Cadophora gregata]KAK0123950.1 hypothetical protein ONS95_008939 [Cadophora gregata]KAK0130289.1 hypothetical protein ONS96_000811 [Cadophora gregata f. sp. sojae]
MVRWTPRSFSIWKRASFLAFVFVLAFLVCSPSDKKQSNSFFSSRYSQPQICPHSAIAEKIVISVKTGATEAAAKIPIQRQTTLRCAEHVFFFSDLEQDLEEGQYHLHDALDTISPLIMDNNQDFDFYKKQRALWRTQKNITDLKGAKHPVAKSDLAAWSLDKWKNIHMLEKVWALKPDMDWYIFIDADTYLVWTNLLTWLETLDPTTRTFYGSVSTWNGIRYAHGGSGYMISKALMYEMAVKQKGVAALWDAKLHDHCCGDIAISAALQDYGGTLEGVWPLISRESPWSMPFGPGTPEYRCWPAITMHHLTPVGMEEFVKFEEQRRDISVLLTHSEILQDFLLSQIPDSRSDWDNLASEAGEFGHTGGVFSDAASFEECSKTCEQNKDCLQYSYHETTCSIGKSVRLGHARDADEDGSWHSGWNKTRLADWVKAQPPCGHVAFEGEDN